MDRLKTAYTDNTNSCNGHTTTGQGNYNDTYNYSSGGNLTSKTGSGNSSSTNGTYSYSDPDLAHAVTSTSDGSTYAYDDNGNMTTRNPNGEPSQTLAWDPDQRLEQVTVAGGSTTSFLYDADGARVRRQTGSTTNYYTGGSEYERNGSSGAFTHYYNVGGDTVAYNNNGTVTWMWKDFVSSTALTRTGSSNSIQRYTPWGEVRTDGNLTIDREYTGQIADKATGLAFYNARYYDTAVGRFVSPDTLVPDEFNGQEYNRYSYVRNNPVKFSDPSGHETCIEHADGHSTCWSDLEMMSLIREAADSGRAYDAYSDPENFTTTGEAARVVSFGGTPVTLLANQPTRPVDCGLNCWGDFFGGIQKYTGVVQAGCAAAMLVPAANGPATACATGLEPVALSAGAIEVALDCGASVRGSGPGSECLGAMADWTFDFSTFFLTGSKHVLHSTESTSFVEIYVRNQLRGVTDKADEIAGLINDIGVPVISPFIDELVPNFGVQ